MSYYRQPRNYRKPRGRSRPSGRTSARRSARKLGRVLCLPVIIWIVVRIWQAGLVQ